mmetsp:Transcript_25611/g.50107  ORF Transcript_25611/g.50107 Transcript_25611/m.50107 type:complete len:85 (-) Transcript_25611:268-522(-)
MCMNDTGGFSRRRLILTDKQKQADGVMFFVCTSVHDQTSKACLSRLKVDGSTCINGSLDGSQTVGQRFMPENESAVKEFKTLSI